LDGARSVQENIADGLDQVVINGRPRHIIGYLKDFRFTPERARAPVRVLSGGERNRLLLAKLFARPANVLVLDEPTNDLDLETLELLEELLVAFTGTVLLVSHDRTFIDNVVTSVMAFEGPGCVREYVGGYADWLRQRPQTPPPPDRDAAPARGAVRKPPPKPRKLSYRETRELEVLPETIQGLENEQADIYRTLSDPGSYQQGGEGIAGARRRLEDLERQLAAAYLRWEELDAVAQGSGAGAARIERKRDGKQA